MQGNLSSVLFFHFFRSCAAQVQKMDGDQRILRVRFFFKKDSIRS
jgi:hypothetical protein